MHSQNNSSDTNINCCEVLVIGGGPAGSTIAALLAEKGRHVVLVEKDQHPRFHIGESLLPLNLPLFEQLGVKEQIEQIGMPKYGAEFNSAQHGKVVTFEFANAWDKAYPYAYQVKRAEFDHLLLKNCAAKGATVLEQCRVTAVEFKPKPDGQPSSLVTLRDAAGDEQRWQADFLVDASGRDTFLAGKFGIKRRNKKHNSAAVFGHFSGAIRPAGLAEGNISIFWFAHGWFWFIPLKDGITSIGAVCWPYYMKTRKTDPADFLRDTIALCPQIAQRLEHASLVSPVTATGNYSYQSDRMAGPGYIMLGDAFAFIDPVFSSGVFLAMSGAFMGAEVVDDCLRVPQSAPRLLKAFDATVRRGLRRFSWFIYRVTAPAMRDMLMAPRNIFRVEESLLSLLAGDVFRPSPVHRRLTLLKGIYYAKSLARLPASFAAWRQRKRAISLAGDGDTVAERL